MFEFIIKCQKDASLCKLVNLITVITIFFLICSFIFSVTFMNKKKWNKGKNFILMCEKK